MPRACRPCRRGRGGSRNGLGAPLSSCHLPVGDVHPREGARGSRAVHALVPETCRGLIARTCCCDLGG